MTTTREAWAPVNDLLDSLGPYPGHGNADPVTAEGLVRHFLVSAQAENARGWALPSGEPGSPEAETWQVSVRRYVDRWAIAALLVRLIEHAPDRADAVAADLVDAMDDGGSMGEWLWEWLNGRGIDPDEITRRVDAAVEAERTA